MKKLAIFSVILLIYGGLMAQSQMQRMTDARNVFSTASVKIMGGSDDVGNGITAGTPTSGTRAMPFIGESNWPKQTNGAWHNKLIAHPNGTLSAIWPVGPTSEERGTGYNFFNGTSWTGTSSDRIESQRAGWGCVCALNGGGEMVISHNGTTGLTINKRAVAGQGAWQESTLTGPVVSNGTATSTGLYWPVVASVGDTIHLFAITESDPGYLYQGISTCLVYYRSIDNGATWDINAELVGGLDAAYMPRFTADAYELAAKPGCVALVYGTQFTDVFMLKSTDGGLNFTKTMIFDNPIPNDIDMSTPAGIFDTTFVSNETYAIAIDDQNNVHLAFGIIRVIRT
ncbi:MAG: hypothetical protein LBV46_00355, partial [Bacteroidales bacterium]|nr:hypothetical protein [Bacteroidales bacterium]